MGKFKMQEITGVIAAMITPYDKDENVDTGRINALVDFLLERDIGPVFNRQYRRRIFDDIRRTKKRRGDRCETCCRA